MILKWIHVFFAPPETKDTDAVITGGGTNGITRTGNVDCKSLPEDDEILQTRYDDFLSYRRTLAVNKRIRENN